ncbi:MAG: hypothetical protein EAY75_15680 [Bacteroidetes bacterium]|nr:MAG: hypothetical protein EAY75_15680 [Bacteroidota bacterium]
MGGCKKDEIEFDSKFILHTKPLSREVLKNIVRELRIEGLERNATGDRQRRTRMMSSQQLQTVLNPLVENGRALHQELIFNVSNSAEWLLLEPALKDSLVQLTDQDYALLSVLFSEAEINLGGAIKDCVGVALGISGIKGILKGLTTAPTVSGAIALLKTMGKRYLNWIGVAWMILDFIDCMSHFEV